MEHLEGMEHRLAPRSDLDVEAVVVLGDGRTTPGTIRNVSLTGVFVELPRSDLAADHGMIRLTFARPDTRGGAAAFWQGFIVRRDGHGIGAIFDSDEEEDWDGLAELLRSVKSSSSHDRRFLRGCLEHLIAD